MNRKELLRLAGMAGFPIESDDEGEYIGCWDFLPREETLERFAAIVAAHEREECAKICDSYADGSHSNLSDLCADAIRAFRRARGNT